MATTLEQIAVQLARALEPLRYAVGSAEVVGQALELLGWQPPPNVDLGALFDIDPSDSLAALKVVLDSNAVDRQDTSLMRERYAALVLAVLALVGSISKAAADLSTALSGMPEYLERTDIVKELPRRLLDLLVAGRLGIALPGAYAILRLLGIVRRVPFLAVPEKFQVAHTRTVIEYDRLRTLFADPRQLFVLEYGWATAEFDSARLLENVAVLGIVCGLRTRSRDLPFGVEERLLGTQVDASADQPVRQVTINLTRALGPAAADLGVSALGLRPSDAGAVDGGIGVLGYLLGGAVESVRLNDRLTVEIAAELGLSGGVMMELRPGVAVVRTSVAGDAGNIGVSARLALGLRYKLPSEERLQVFSLASGTRLEISQSALQVEVDLADGTADSQPAIEPQWGLLAEAGPGTLVVAAGDGDGFLAKVLPPGGFRTDFDLAVGWSNRRGLYFRGGAALEVSLPVHTTYLGVIRLEEVDLLLAASADGKIRLGVAVTGSLTLGPVTATVTRVGLRADVAFPEEGGNLGPAQLGIGFRPPDGAGLSIDTPVVTGAGFLLMDEAKGLYAGFLQLEIAEVVSVLAIGLITTKLPDGSPGFSLLVVLTADFPPIQLSFGFTLNGLGGLLGVNRTMAVDVLRAGVRSRILESILFPKEPVKNANKVIADIQSAFPVAPGRFVIGLMAKVGWGSPTVVSLELGIIVELPAPIRIALIGRLTLAVPEELEEGEQPTVRLRMDVVGILDFDRREASIDASLFDSVVAGFTLSGDMAMRLSFGDRPAFALSVGGFHPRFVPPPEFPQLGRMTIALATSDSPQIRLEAYFATTPATFQFGARLDVYAEADAGVFGFFTATAYLSFDALVEVVPPPMRFVVEIAGGVTLRRNGAVLAKIDLRMSLSGTRPWRACGEATFEFLGKRHIPFDVTIGEVAALLGLPALDPLGDLVAALTDRRNWEARTPRGTGAGTGGLVSVREPDLGDDVVVHPLGSVSVRQQVLPLGLDIQRYKEVDLPAAHRYDITGVSFGGQPVGGGDEVRAFFAAGDFVSLTEAEKLARPSFEPFVAGRSRMGFPAGSVAQVPVSFGTPVERPDDAYDTVVIDQIEPRPTPAPGYVPHAVVLDALPATAAGGQSPLRTTGTAGFAGPALGIRLADPEYAVASGDTLARVGVVHPTFTDAAAVAAASGGTGTAAAGTRVVVGAHEVH